MHGRLCRPAPTRKANAGGGVRECCRCQQPQNKKNEKPPQPPQNSLPCNRNQTKNQV